MFNMDDFENIQKPNERNGAPDYMHNDQEFINSMMLVTRLIRDTDFTEHTSRTSFMMHMMNMAVDEPNKSNERSLNIINALSSHIISLIQTIGNNKDQYINHFDESVIIPMINDGPDIPIWGD